MTADQLDTLKRMVANHPPHWPEEKAALAAAVEELERPKEPVDNPTTAVSTWRELPAML